MNDAEDAMQDFGFKTATGLLALLCGTLLYRMEHPRTAFVPDGADARWDGAARMCRQANQPAVVLFTANWCPVCQALESDVLSRSEVRKELDRHYFYYVVDLSNPTKEDRQRAQKFKVTGIPTMIRYDDKGQESDRTHYLDAERLVAWLQAGE
jgi:thiol:disulfide interchange protein